MQNSLQNMKYRFSILVLLFLFFLFFFRLYLFLLNGHQEPPPTAAVFGITWRSNSTPPVCTPNESSSSSSSTSNPRKTFHSWLFVLSARLSFSSLSPTLNQIGKVQTLLLARDSGDWCLLTTRSTPSLGLKKFNRTNLSNVTFCKNFFC